MKTRQPYNSPQKREHLKNLLVEALKVPINTIDTRPNILIEEFEKPGVMDDFFKVVEWYLNDLKDFYKAV